MLGRGIAGRAIFACALLTGVPAAAAPAPATKPAATSPVPPEAPKIGPVEAARDAFARHDYATAVDRLRGFIDASVGTPRLDEARDMLVKVATTWSIELDRQGQCGLGARALLDCSTILGADGRAADLKLRARQLLQAAYDNALRRKQYDRSLRAALEFARLFPDQLRLADDATLRTMQAGWLAAQQQQQRARAEYVYEKLRALQRAGAGQDVLDPFKLNPNDIALACARELHERGWYAQAAAVLRENLIFTQPSPAARRQMEQSLGKAYAASAEAWLTFGNGTLAQRAIDLLETSPDAPTDPASLARYRAALDKLGLPPAAPRLLTASTRPIQGDGVWDDAGGGGYVLPDRIRIGHNPANYNGVATDTAVSHVDVRPGFYLDGGTLTVSNGVLSFKGEPQRPIILRRVRIECEYTGIVRATHTLFEDCTFVKTGIMRWDAGYSAKWELTDCLIRECQFPSLSRMNYGLKLVRCAFDHCTFPSRRLTDVADEDAARLYKSEWNQVEDCDFYTCTLPPSVLWVTRNSNFWLCRLADPETYFGKTDIDVSLGVPPEESADFLQDVTSHTSARGGGKVKYTLPPRPYPRARPLTLWRWAADATPATPTPKPAH